ncbi:response regulator transcription factor [Gilvimarinus polysaccharolyticus]|uniref:response regulator transcription factor n=1 Tax=Gilvimarinus polysaccharolyticus TaxID=863921 RepID=UPI00067351F4|nr:response regulator transcription factor [Gilvimarinus polysaccharolyticus]
MINMIHTTSKILIVEDELAARSLLSSYLEEQGWSVDVSCDGLDVVDQVLKNDYDLVFLDIRLPKVDGLLLCREIRASHPAGIIFTTSIDDPVERIVGLEAGADAYYSKPLPMRELIANSKALLRRVQQVKSLQQIQLQQSKKSYYFESWHMDAELEKVSGVNGDVRLTNNEAAVMQVLCAHAGVAVKRDALMHALGKADWGPFDRTLDVLVGRLRTKLKSVVPARNLISAQYGQGYRLNASPR